MANSSIIVATIHEVADFYDQPLSEDFVSALTRRLIKKLGTGSLSGGATSPAEKREPSFNPWIDKLSEKVKAMERGLESAEVPKDAVHGMDLTEGARPPFSDSWASETPRSKPKFDIRRSNGSNKDSATNITATTATAKTNITAVTAKTSATAATAKTSATAVKLSDVLKDVPSTTISEWNRKASESVSSQRSADRSTVLTRGTIPTAVIQARLSGGMTTLDRLEQSTNY